MGARLLLGDCVEALRGIPDGSVDALLTDPPAGISFMDREWDSDRGGREQWVAWLASVMTECLRTAKPGAHALVWALPRTSHWTAWALEDAGWELRDCVVHLFSTGFPKSLDISKQIDRRLGAERTEIVGYKDSGLDKGSGVSVDFSEAKGRDETGLIPVTAPATAAAAAAAGWGTALKPAWECWWLARKPIQGTIAENFMENGTGGLHIDACRIGAAGGTRQTVAKAAATGREATSQRIGSASGGNEDAGGRWPANALLTHDPRCEGSGPHHTEELCVPECPVRRLNEQSGESSSSCIPVYAERDSGYHGAWGGGGPGRQVGADDAGGAARFFYVAKPRPRERIGGTIRNLHPTAKSIDLMRYLARLVCPSDGLILDPFMGSGTTGCAAMVEGFRFVGIEKDDASFETALARVSDYAHAYGRERPSRS